MPPASPRPLLLKPSPQASPSPQSPQTPPSPRAPPPLSVSSAPRAPAATPPTPAPVNKLSISRNYVIPPRPKPGRKPSQEVPPSRRKAQNREAQRAFRERKSQVVKALEEQLAQQAKEFEKQQQYMKEQIAALQRQTSQSQPVAVNLAAVPHQLPPVPLPSISSPHNSLSSPSFGSPTHHLSLNYPLNYPQSPNYSAGSPPASNLAPPGAKPAHAQASQPTNKQLNTLSGSSPVPVPMQPQFVPAPSPPAMGFYAPSPSYFLATSPHTPPPAAQLAPNHFKGLVTPADYVGLELLDHVLEQKLPSAPPSPRSPHRHSPSPPSAALKRRHSRLALVAEVPRSPGVVRTDPPYMANPLDLVNTDWHQPAVPLRRRSSSLETDFTTAFALVSPKRPKPFVFALTPPAHAKDRCGFCTDDTPCVCAESAARERNSDQATDLMTLGSPISSPLSSPLAHFAVSSEPLGSGSPLKHSREVKNVAENTNGWGCTGNPSNCMQCQQDPMLTLFCSAISSKPPAAKLPALGTYIPAQAAYKTLSRHPHFSAADLGELVNSLLVKSSQVEVNSVAKVLRMLDTQVRPS